MNAEYKQLQLLTDFIQFISQDTDSTISGLKVLFTRKELKELTRRLLILKFLILGYSHRKIASILNVGIATITRGSKELQLSRSFVVRQFFKTKGQEYWRK